MEKDLYIKLIYKKLKNELSESDAQILETWLSADPENQKLADEISSDWALSQNYAPTLDIDVKGDFNKLKQRIAEADKKTKIVPITKKRSIWPRVAAAMIILGIGYWFIPKGGPEMTFVATGPGESKEIILEDGSHVWLNENSSLNYPKTYGSKTRLVELKGEAFFDIARNEQKQFVVMTEDTKVAVLGTSFNVNAQDKQTDVYVQTGTVSFESKDNKSKAILKKGTSAVYDKSKNQVQQSKQTANDLAWRTGVLNFENASMIDVLNRLKDHFKVDINTTSASIKGCTFTGRFDNESVDDALNYIADIYQSTLSRDNKTYTFKGGQCQ